MKPQDLFEKCQEQCRICADETVACTIYCDRLPGMERCISFCRAAEKACRDVVLLGRPSDDVFRACADACRSCADACAAYDDIHCRSCADTCRKCSELCDTMVIYSGN